MVKKAISAAGFHAFGMQAVRSKSLEKSGAPLFRKLLISKFSYYCLITCLLSNPNR